MRKRASTKPRLRPRVRRPWNRVSLHRHLLNLLSRPSTTLRTRQIRGSIAARVDFDDIFPPAYVHIDVDANNTPIIRFVIHELLHVVLSELVIGKFDETLEEVLIVALDGYIYEWVAKSKSRSARWTALIEKKLTENDADLEPVPLEEQVDRREGS